MWRKALWTQNSDILEDKNFEDEKMLLFRSSDIMCFYFNIRFYYFKNCRKLVERYCKMKINLGRSRIILITSCYKKTEWSISRNVQCFLKLNACFIFVHGKTTYEWHTSTYEWHTVDIRVHMSHIRVHTSDIRMTYDYIRVTYGWNTSTYNWHTNDIWVHIDKI